MTPLPYLSILQVAGADAAKFLQSQVSAHLVGLSAPSASFAAYCSPKGKVFATILIAPRDDHWLLVMESSLLETVTGRLQQYVMRDQVKLEPKPDQFLCAVEPHDVLAPSMIVMEPRTVPVQYAISDVQLPPSPESTARWRRSELLFGIPWLNAQSSEKYIPQMLGLDTIGAVSFSKGCYPGQEIIARARHLGEVKRRPQVLDIDGPSTPDPNAPCHIRTSGGQVQATLVHCIAGSNSTFTVFAVAALQADDAIEAVEQNGQLWTAKRACEKLQP